MNKSEKTQDFVFLMFPLQFRTILEVTEAQLLSTQNSITKAFSQNGCRKCPVSATRSLLLWLRHRSSSWWEKQVFGWLTPVVWNRVTGAVVRSMHQSKGLDWRWQRSRSVSRPSEAAWQSSSTGSRHNSLLRRQVCAFVWWWWGWLSQPKLRHSLIMDVARNVQTLRLWPLLPRFPISLPSD